MGNLDKQTVLDLEIKIAFDMREKKPVLRKGPPQSNEQLQQQRQTEPEMVTMGLSPQQRQRITFSLHHCNSKYCVTSSNQKRNTIHVSVYSLKHIK